MEVMWSQHTPYIEPFDMQHFIYIGILVSTLALMIRNRDSIRENRELYGRVILGLSVFQQILLYTWYGLEMGFNLSESLPLHICRISSLLGIWFLISRNHKVLDVMFFFGLYAYGSFLYPSRVYPIYHAIGISFVLNHAITILLPWFGYIAYGWIPNKEGMKRSMILFLGYFMFVYLLNPIIDGNYFYLKYRPFFTQWPEHIYVPFIVSFTLAGFYLAYWTVDRFLGNESYNMETGEAD